MRILIPAAVASLLLLAGASSAAEKAKAAVTLDEVDGRRFDDVLKQHRGRVVLVDFWATWCAPCKQMFAQTVELNEKYKDRGLDVISVSFDDLEQRGDALEFLTEKNARFANYISKDGFDSSEAFDIGDGALPYYRIYDRAGKLVKTFASGDPDRVFKESDIAAAVEALLSAKP